MPDKLNILIKNKPLSIFVTGLILLTIFLRFYKLESTAYFVNDQGRDMKVLYNLVYEKKLTLIGPATSFAADYGNIYFGPYYYYFMAIFYLINHSVLFITGIYPFLFILGTIIFLRVPSFKPIEKVITLIFLIFSWISLYYTRFIWNLNMAFLLSFILFSTFLILEKSIVKSRLWSLLFGIIAGSIFQIHYGMLFLYLGFLVFIAEIKKYSFLSFGIVIVVLALFCLRHPS